MTRRLGGEAKELAQRLKAAPSACRGRVRETARKHPAMMDGILSEAGLAPEDVGLRRVDGRLVAVAEAAKPRKEIPPEMKAITGAVALAKTLTKHRGRTFNLPTIDSKLPPFVPGAQQAGDVQSIAKQWRQTMSPMARLALAQANPYVRQAEIDVMMHQGNYGQADNGYAAASERGYALAGELRRADHWRELSAKSDVSCQLGVVSAAHTLVPTLMMYRRYGGATKTGMAVGSRRRPYGQALMVTSREVFALGDDAMGVLDRGETFESCAPVDIEPTQDGVELVLSCLREHDDSILAPAFTSFAVQRAWASPTDPKETGINL